MTRQTKGYIFIPEGSEKSPSEFLLDSQKTTEGELSEEQLQRAAAFAHVDALRNSCDSEVFEGDSTKEQIAVFDFDGTCIKGNSPVMLVRHLFRIGALRKSSMLILLFWGLFYKMRVPQNDIWVRTLVFEPFEGKPAAEVDAYLSNFYYERISRHFRTLADATMRAHFEAGHRVICISASFEPIIIAMMSQHPVEFEVATRMQVDEDGNYTGKVEGAPVEGPEKLNVLADLADSLFGKDNWEIGWAYGDHYTDCTLLEAAREPYAITPDRALTRLANRNGWDILDWSNE